MDRKVLTDLLKWKNNPKRKPLLIKGANGVGKTRVVKNFGKDNFISLVYFNFLLADNIKNILRNSEKNKLLELFASTSGIKINMKETLFFFDEIQHFDKIDELVEKLGSDYYIICASSFIDSFKYLDKFEILTLYPLDFEEYLWAIKEKALAEKIKEAFFKNEPISGHERILKLFNRYLFAGGMPKIIFEIAQDEMKIYEEVKLLQHNHFVSQKSFIFSEIKDEKALLVFDKISLQLNKENKKFSFTLLNKWSKHKDYTKAISNLLRADLIYQSKKLLYTANSENSNDKSFKLYLNDFGLLNANYIYNDQIILNNFDEAINIKIALLENFAAQTLKSRNKDLYYWESTGNASINFVIKEDKELIPLEINLYGSLKSKCLKVFMKIFETNKGIRLSYENFHIDKGISCIPFYALHCL